MKPYIICGGSIGRTVVYGYLDGEPVVGEPVTIHQARMVLRWDEACGGLFGLATNGPRGDTRLTDSVDQAQDTVRQSLTVTDEAAKSMNGWASYDG